MANLPAVHGPTLILPSGGLPAAGGGAETPTLVKPIEAYVIFFEVSGVTTATTVIDNLKAIGGGSLERLCRISLPGVGAPGGQPRVGYLAFSDKGTAEGTMGQMSLKYLTKEEW